MFSDYQTLTDQKSGPAKPYRSIPQRVEDYGLMDYLDNDSEVLDIGCNQGMFGVYLLGKIENYTGIDPDVDQLPDSDVNEYIPCAFEYFQVDKQYSHIFSFAVHSYIKMTMQVYCNKIISLLKPNGFLFLEGHPDNYRGEPQEYWEPLIKALLGGNMQIVRTRKIIDRGLRRKFFVFQKPLSVGMAGKVFRRNGIIEKHYFRERGKFIKRHIWKHLKKELAALYKLDGIHFPKVLRVTNRVLFMDDCGEEINKINRPLNWADQCKEIDESLSDAGIYHSDVMSSNVLVKDGVIKLIDFGICSEKKYNDRNSFEWIGNI